VQIYMYMPPRYIRKMWSSWNSAVLSFQFLQNPHLIVNSVGTTDVFLCNYPSPPTEHVNKSQPATLTLLPLHSACLSTVKVHAGLSLEHFLKHNTLDSEQETYFLCFCCVWAVEERMLSYQPLSTKKRQCGRIP
jgi:hypothetical protein